MRRLMMAFIVSLLLAASLPSMAQDTRLTTLVDNMARLISEKKPGWKHEPVTPMEGSKRVVLQQWTSGDQRVRIAITPYDTPDKASKVIQGFASDGRLKERLPNLGDEGLSWGSGVVSFRKRHLTIHVSAVATDLTEEYRLSKEFAQLVADTLSVP